MESRAKLFGHPVHPMLVVFPLGLLTAAAGFDVVGLAARRPAFGAVGFWNSVAGTAGALAAGGFGLWDWLAIPWGTRAKAIGLWHAAGNAVVLALFGISVLRRRRDPGHQPSAGTTGLELAGVAVAAVAGWLGGEMVDRLGVGVDAGAHLDAPSSLSGRPASEDAGGRRASGGHAGADAGRRPPHA